MIFGFIEICFLTYGFFVRWKDVFLKTGWGLSLCRIFCFQLPQIMLCGSEYKLCRILVENTNSASYYDISPRIEIVTLSLSKRGLSTTHPSLLMLVFCISLSQYIFDPIFHKARTPRRLKGESPKGAHTQQTSLVFYRNNFGGLAGSEKMWEDSGNP